MDARVFAEVTARLVGHIHGMGDETDNPATGTDFTAIGGEHERLAAAVRSGLDAGMISARDVRHLIAGDAGRPRRSVAAVVVAVGVFIAYAGSALLYAVNFADLPDTWQLVSPFAFPLLSLGGALGIAARGRAGWVSEAAFSIGYVSLAGSVAASASAIADGSQDVYVFAVASAIAAGVLALLRLLPGRVVVSYWALCAALSAATIAGAWSVGVIENEQRWVLLSLGMVGAVAGWQLLRIGPARAAGAASAFGAAAMVLASMVGAGQVESAQLTPWHAVLTVAVVVAILAGTFAYLPELAAAGGIGALLWFGMAAGIISQRPVWAVAVIAIGLAMVGVTAALMRHRARRPGSRIRA